MWDQLNSAADRTRTEGAAAVQMARDLTVFDKPDSDRIRQSLLGYERAAVAEWPVAASGHSYPETDNALKRLYTAYEQVQPRTDTQKTFLGTSFTNLDKISQARTERLLQARTDIGPPWSLWAVILSDQWAASRLRDRLRRRETRHALHHGCDRGRPSSRQPFPRLGSFAEGEGRARRPPPRSRSLEAHQQGKPQFHRGVLFQRVD